MTSTDPRVLTEAADRIEKEIRCQTHAEAHGVRNAIDLVRRMAAEAQPDTANPSVVTDRVLSEVLAERVAQDEKWGEQNHPDVETRDIPLVTHHYYASRADIWRQVNEERATPSNTARCKTHCRTGSDEPHTHTAWDGVLLEEVYEALAESDPAALRTELVQVAAVATAWIEAIDRRTAAPAVVPAR